MNSAPLELYSNRGRSPNPNPEFIANLITIPSRQTNPGQKRRIFVVEDHPFVREGIVALINRQPDLVCCGQADSIAATPSLLAEQQPHLVLLDLRLKDGEAFDLIKTLRIEFPEAAILVLSQGDEEIYAERVLR